MGACPRSRRRASSCSGTRSGTWTCRRTARRCGSRWTTLRVGSAAGQTVVIACYGGYGRTGTVVGCLLRDAGLDGAAAIALARATRPGAVERPGQVTFVEEWGTQRSDG